MPLLLNTLHWQLLLIEKPLKPVISAGNLTTDQCQVKTSLNPEDPQLTLEANKLCNAALTEAVLRATVRQDDTSRECFVDTEKTWFLEYSQLNVWISGLWHETGAGCELEAPHCASELHSTPKIPLPGQEIEILCSIGTLVVIYHMDSWGDGGKRRPSVDQRWAAGPGFKGKAKSILSSTSITHIEDHLSDSTPHQRGAVGLPHGARIEIAFMCPHYDSSRSSSMCHVCVLKQPVASNPVRSSHRLQACFKRNLTLVSFDTLIWHQCCPRLSAKFWLLQRPILLVLSSPLVMHTTNSQKWWCALVLHNHGRKCAPCTRKWTRQRIRGQENVDVTGYVKV